MVLLAPGVSAVGKSQGNGDIESLTGDAAESVEDSLVKGTGKGALLKRREGVDSNAALLRGTQVTPPTHPFSYGEHVVAKTGMSKRLIAEV